MDIKKRNEVIEYIYSTGLVPNYLKKIGFVNDFEDFEDILQELWLAICETKDETLEKLLNQGKEKDPYYAVRGYVSGLIYRQIRSKNSKIYYKYKKSKEKEFTHNDTGWAMLETIADDPFNYDIFFNTSGGQ